MTSQQTAKKPVLLFVVWIIASLLLTAFNKYGFLFGIEASSPTLGLTITLLAIALFFLPLMFVIYRQAKAVSLKWLALISRIVLIFLSCVLPIFLIVLLVMIATGQGDGSVVP